MTRAAVIAWSAASALGEGRAAIDPGREGEAARVALGPDAELARLGLARPVAGRVARAPVLHDDPATSLLLRVTRDLVAQLDARMRASEPRVGLVIGTSSGGMCAAERLFDRAARGESVDAALARAATYFGPFETMRSALGDAGFPPARARQLVTACAASTWALGVGQRWLASGTCDLVIAGGYDVLGLFVPAGFEALRATTASLPAPFRVARDGMALGEGAALVALVREGEEASVPRFWVSGFGASTDAVHPTAPDRTGAGLARAAVAALADAGVPASACALVSAHATATPFNDAMEARALTALFGADIPVVQALKAQIGHTLGAAGALETIAVATALAEGVAPAAAGAGALDPDAAVPLLPVGAALASDARAALKLSAAFGGANAALIVEHAKQRSRRAPRAVTRATVASWCAVRAADLDAVAHASGQDRDRVARVDEPSLLFASAVAGLGAPERLRGAGVVVGHALATLEINARFFRRVRERGVAAAEPRLFPATSPNLVPGQAAIWFGLTGPSAALASGPGTALDALALAIELVEAGDAPAVVVGAVDVGGVLTRDVLDAAFDGGPDAAPGAVAALVIPARDGALALSRPPSDERFGHLALVAYLAAIAPEARSA